MSWTQSETGGHEKHGQSVVYDESTGESVAIVYNGERDAKLIAAAPDMLDALRTVRNRIDDFILGDWTPEGTDEWESLARSLTDVIARTQ